MKPRYEDILKKIDVDPFWYDENGVPRYLPFHPSLSSSIYSTEVVLLKINNQSRYHKRGLQDLIENPKDDLRSIYIRKCVKLKTNLLMFGENSLKPFKKTLLMSIVKK